MKTVGILLLMMVVGFDLAYGAVNIERLADAIYIAEGGAKTNHPYGILKHYRDTTPRQACINTINHALKDFKGEEKDFILYLGNRYAPIGVANDPSNMNRNWIKNVKYWYEK